MALQTGKKHVLIRVFRDAVKKEINVRPLSSHQFGACPRQRRCAGFCHGIVLVIDGRQIDYFKLHIRVFIFKFGQDRA